MNAQALPIWAAICDVTICATVNLTEILFWSFLVFLNFHMGELFAMALSMLRGIQDSTVTSSFFPSADDVLLPPPGWAQGLLTGVCILSIILPKGPMRLSVGPVIISFYFYLLFWTHDATRSAYLAGVSLTGIVLKWIDFVVIHSPEQDFWEVQSDKGEPKIRKCPQSVWQKLKWFSKLFNSLVGVGWNIQPAKTPAAPTSTRFEFLKTTFRDLIIMYLRLDIVQNIIKYIYANEPMSHSFFAFPLPTQIFLAWAKAFKLHHHIHLLYFTMSFVSVLFNIYQPRDWPPIMGCFRSDAYTVRKMWGTCWHQMMRRPCSEAGRIVKSLFGFRTGSFLSKYSQLWVGFAVSLAIHHGGAKMGAFEDGGYWQAAYFAVQSAGIMFEDGIIGLGRRMGIVDSVWTRRVGFLWVFCWFSWTLRWMVAYNPRGWADNLDVPSLTDWIMNSQWKS